MKKVTAFVGSPRKKHTYDAVRQFLTAVQSLGGVESEIVILADYRLKTCRGCQRCFLKGEECCPLDDERNVLLDKMRTSDGVVFASPNYSFQVSAIMKTFLDRLGFVFHRPCFFGKVFTSIVVQGIYGGPQIVKYLDFVGNGLGFSVVRGSCLTALEPMTEEGHRTIERTLAAHSRRFHARLRQPPYSVPTLFQLMMFRNARTSIALMLNETYRDYTYYRDHGWFESDYFYPARLNLLKRAAGSLFDYSMTRKAIKGRPQTIQ